MYELKLHSIALYVSQNQQSMYSLTFLSIIWASKHRLKKYENLNYGTPCGPRDHLHAERCFPIIGKKKYFFSNEHKKRKA